MCTGRFTLHAFSFQSLIILDEKNGNANALSRCYPAAEQRDDPEPILPLTIMVAPGEVGP